MMMQGDPPTCCYAAAERKVLKLNFEYLHIYSPKGGDFSRKNSKIENSSLMSCERSDLRKTLKYSQSRDLESIQ